MAAKLHGYMGMQSAAAVESMTGAGLLHIQILACYIIVHKQMLARNTCNDGKSFFSHPTSGSVH